MAWYIFLGTMAAFGGFCALWAMLGWLVPAGADGLIFYPGHSGAMGFARRYLWLRSLGMIRCTLVIADTALTEAERKWLEANGIGIEPRHPGAEWERKRID